MTGQGQRQEHTDEQKLAEDPEHARLPFGEMNARRLLAFRFFVHVLNRWLVDDDVGLRSAVHLQAVLVVPLDHAVDLFAVAEHDHHGCLALHLLLIVKIFGVRSFRRSDLAGASRSSPGAPSTGRGRTWGAFAAFGRGPGTVAMAATIVSVQRGPD